MRTDEDYVQSGIWGDNCGDKDSGGMVALLPGKVVTTRKPHNCPGHTKAHPNHHEILPGTRAVRETALFEGEGYKSAYTCLECIDSWLDEVEGYNG